VNKKETLTGKKWRGEMDCVEDYRRIMLLTLYLQEIAPEISSSDVSPEAVALPVPL